MAHPMTKGCTMKRLALHALAALLAAGSLHGIAAAQQSELPSAPRETPPSAGAITPDADEMAAIRKARERCRDAGGPEDQQACMNRAQIEYYQQRDGASGKDMSPSDAPTPVLPSPNSMPSMPGDRQTQ